MAKEEEHEERRCPECGAPLLVEWSGVQCSECDYWISSVIEECVGW